MRTSSIKAKGRRVQNLVAGFFSIFGQKFLGLKEGDVAPRPMGQSGVDVIFSPLAYKFFNFDIECKNVEKLNIVATYNKHARQYEKTLGVPLLIHAKNHSKTLVTLSFEDLLDLMYVRGPGGDTILAQKIEIQHILQVVDGCKDSWEAIQRISLAPPAPAVSQEASK